MNVHSSVIHKWEQPKYPSTDKWIKEIQHTHKMKYFSTTQRNEIDSYVGILRFIPAVRAPRAGPETSLSGFPFYSQFCCPWSLGEESQSLGKSLLLGDLWGLPQYSWYSNSKSPPQTELRSSGLAIVSTKYLRKRSPGAACVGLLTIKSSDMLTCSSFSSLFRLPVNIAFRQSSWEPVALREQCAYGGDTGGGVWQPEFCFPLCQLSVCVLWQELQSPPLQNTGM